MTQTIVITGASSGIGKKLAQRFIEEGCNVALLARRQDRLNDIIQQYPNRQNHILGIACDVNHREAVHAAIQTCYTHFGSIDTLIANAGISISSPGDTLDAQKYAQVFQTNVFGALYCFEAVIPKMIKNKSGHLVGISSLASYRGLPQGGAYSGSKAALSTIMESLRLDLKQYHIPVTLINPGFIQTPLTDKNLYKMPFLLTVDQGVNHIYKAIQKKAAIYAFPWPLATAVRLLRLLPASWYDRLISRHKNIKKEESE